MKKIIIIAALFCSFSASAQYTYIAQRYEWLAGVFRALGLPAGPGPAAFQTSQRQQAGAVYYDSVGVDSGLYVYSGLAWRLYSAGGSQNLQSVTNIGNITTTDLIVGNTAQTPLVSLFNLDNAGAISLRATDSSFYSYLRQAGALTAPQYTFFPVGTGNDTLATLADVRAGGGGFTNPMTTAEDIIIGGVGGTPIRKGVGANGTVLGVSSGALNYLTGAPWSGLHGSTSVSASTTLTLTTQSVYVFTGSSPATYTLPDRAANAARTYFIKNAGTANITLTRAGSDELWTTTNVTSVTIAPGESLATISLTSYWYVYFDNNDANLLFDSLGTAGISPVTVRDDTLMARRISISGGSIDTTASGGLLITVSGISAIGQPYLITHTSGTTWTTPADITTSTRFKITLVGGGGGGGGMNTTNAKAGAGGAGGALVVYVTGLSPSTGYTMAIGAAGAAGASTPTDGGAGGNTTLTIGATTYTGNGGAGGLSSGTFAGGAGGTATNGDINITGQSGEDAPATASAAVAGASGGNSAFGLGVGGSATRTLNGKPGTGYGAGGGGAVHTAATGGAGTQGIIIIEYFK